jgi:hypothetical protein
MPFFSRGVESVSIVRKWVKEGNEGSLDLIVIVRMGFVNALYFLRRFYVCANG